ncbi:MAG: energy-coupling factor ABC transporter ATP-binding protein [Caldimicrobium sp.]
MDFSIRLKVNLKNFILEENNFTLKEISFEVCRGQALAILGPSGSGKTTLLKVLDGLYKDYEGEILLDNIELKKLTPKEIYKKMGLLFQNPEEQLFAEKVFEDVGFGPKNMGWPDEKIKESVKKALELVSLSGFELKAIHKLSFGEKKRVALAGLLAMGHEILLLDEPTLGLDPLLEKNFMELLLNLKNRGYTIIMATHNVDLVPYFAEKVLILKDGNMVLYGETKEVLSNAKELRKCNLRPPLITELFMSFKDKLPSNSLPFTKEEALMLLSSLLKEKSLK